MIVDFEAVFDSLPCPLVLLARDLTVQAVSDSYLQIAQRRRDDVVGRDFFEVIADPVVDSTPLRAVFERLVESAEDDPRQTSSRTQTVRDANGRVTQLVHRLDDVADDHRARRLLDTAPDAMVVVGPDGRITLVNAQTERLFGYTRAELVGRDLDVLVPSRLRGGHAAHVRRFFTNPNARPMGSGLELFGQRRDGTEIPIEVSLSPLETEEGITISAAIRDISDRQRAAAATKLLADRLSSAVESIQDGFALFDGDDRLVMCNSVYRRLVDDVLPGPLIGRTFAEIAEALVSEIELPAGVSADAFVASQLERRREPAAVVELRLRDGRTLRVFDRRTPEGGLVKVVTDVTEDEQRAQELREARAAAEAGSAAKSEFVASMSHELRTPMNAILGFAQLLQRDRREPLSPRHRARVDQILRGGEHLLRLIDDILDLSRIESGRVSMSAEPVDVGNVLDEVRRTLEPLAARSEVGLVVEPVAADTPMVTADRTRFVQIVMNLGSNAIKYNRPRGKVTFRVSRPDAARVRIAVVDTGTGIPAEKQDKLFQPFQRAGQETGPIEGTGIGLVITRRLALLMNGEVGFSSVEGNGSTFWVDLPSRPAPALVEEPRVLPPPSALGAVGQRTILYVEDNPANVAFMKDLLGSFENIELLTAPTAEMGIQLALAHRPEVVIMDINLPGMSGVEALEVLKKDHGTRDIPVVALTAAASPRDQKRGLDAGFYRYLTKPVKVDDLIAALEPLLTDA